MKLNLSKDWLAKRARLDDDADVGAGTFDFGLLKNQKRIEAIEATADEEPSPGFGRLINLWRREKGLSLEQLAEGARIDLSELIEIERDLHFTPEPRTVFQLSKVLGLPSSRLLELSGNLILRDPALGKEAVRFAARSESVEKLSKDELRALEEFVKYLSEK